MSYEFQPFPDLSGECALCKRHDCSKRGEQWLHFVTLDTDGGYHPAIGMKCVRGMAKLAGFTDKKEIVHEVRPPTDEEITQRVLRLLAEVKAVDDSPSEPDSPSDSTGSVARPRTHRTQARAQGTD